MLIDRFTTWLRETGLNPIGNMKGSKSGTAGEKKMDSPLFWSHVKQNRSTPCSSVPLLQRCAFDRCTPSIQKVKQVGKLRFYKAGVILLAIFAFFLSATATFWMRLYSHFHHKSLRDEIEKAHVRSISESLFIVLSGPNRGERTESEVKMDGASLKEGILRSYRLARGLVPGLETKKEAEALASEVLRIRNQIERFARNEPVRGGVEALRHDLGKIMSHPLYQTIESQDCEAVNFLQFVAIKLLATDGTSALRNYGKRCIGPLKEHAFSPNQLADLMSGYLKQPGFSYKGIQFLLYVACHPLSAMHSAASEMDPLGYDPSEGNPPFSAHAFEVGKKKLIFYYAPGPTGNPIFEHGILPAYEKFNVFEIRFNHQDTIKKSEYYRVKEIERMGEENPKVLKHALLGFDTKMKKNRNLQFENASSFFASYAAYVKGGARGHGSQKEHSGFHIPAHLLNDIQIDRVLAKAERFCMDLSQNNPFWNQMMQQKGPNSVPNAARYLWRAVRGEYEALYPLSYPGKKRMAKMMQLVTDTYLTLAMICRSLDAITPSMVNQTLDKKLDQDLAALRTSGACKQNVDRAVVQNISLRLFFRWIHNPSPLTQEEVYEISGAVFGRARLVDDRKIIEKRFQILNDLLRFIGSAPGGVMAAHIQLKDYPNILRRN